MQSIYARDSRGRKIVEGRVGIGGKGRKGERCLDVHNPALLWQNYWAAMLGESRSDFTSTAGDEVVR
jgi:hypothetical protein